MKTQTHFGMKTREFLELVQGTEVTAIERCSGHDGTYAVKVETYEKAKKIDGSLPGHGNFERFSEIRPSPGGLTAP